MERCPSWHLLYGNKKTIRKVSSNGGLEEKSKK